MIPRGAPSDLLVDLDQCAEEPIRVPERIQPHGVLLALDPATAIIQRASANLAAMTGLAADSVVGRRVDEVFPPAAARVIGRDPLALPDGAPALGVEPLAGLSRSFAVSRHRRAGRLIVELEPRELMASAVAADVAAVATALRDDVDRATNATEVARMTVEAVAEVTRYDRVMVYRFRPDWSGEVIAEMRRPSAVSYLGLRFPASDIPVQARALYAEVPMRVIADIAATPVAIEPQPPAPEAAEPLDLSCALLRAVSPIHIQYLENMGVSATLVLSLLVDGQLWGMIACHHDRAYTPPPETRAAARRLGRLAEAALARLEARRQCRAERRAARHLAAIERLGYDGGNLVRSLLAGDPCLIDLARADGVAIRVGQSMVCYGQTPPPELVFGLSDAIAARGGEVLATDYLTDLLPGAEACREVAAGVMAIAPGAVPDLMFAAFRREQIHDVLWGGDPNKSVERVNEVLTPRRSFAEWRETVIGRSHPWEDEAVASWQALPVWLASGAGGYRAAADRLGADIATIGRPDRAEVMLVRALLNALGGLVVVGTGPRADGAGGPAVVATNRDFRRTFDVVPDELTGLPISAAFDRVGIDGSLLAALPVGGSAELIVATETGERVLDVRHRALIQLVTPEAAFAYSAWLFEDVTRARRVEHALQSARDQALIASRSKSEFLARMSHELRTPLNAIIGFSEIMRAELFGQLGNPRYREYVHHIETSGEHMLGVLGDILDLSKVEAGRYVLEEQQLDLGELVEAVCVIEGDQAERAGVRLMQDLSRSPLHLQGDARAIRQMLLNLLSNSFKFTPEGGMVTCRTLALPDGAIAMEVQDTGVGIAEEHLHRILDPYVQVGRSLTRKTTGTGLGLAVVRVLADLHDARVDVRSQAGRGTALRITFPAWRTIAVDESALLDD